MVLLANPVFAPRCQTAQVSRISWWMSKFGAATAKPQYAYSNSPSIRKVHHYESQPSKVKKDMKAKVQTCRKYTNKQGKECYVGTSELKDTETLAVQLYNL